MLPLLTSRTSRSSSASGISNTPAGSVRERIQSTHSPPGTGTSSLNCAF
ncbi:MAG: hypothetical protein HYU32_11450 [candidate division NC10 bacterium]|nr:hypothetical protein [candidate division NC10 bacterium]